MTEHTPTPWKGPLQSRDCKERNIIDDADGNALLLIVGITAQSRGSRKRIRDAAVLACNSYKDMRTACELALSELDAIATNVDANVRQHIAYTSLQAVTKKAGVK